MRRSREPAEPLLAWSSIRRCPSRSLPFCAPPRDAPGGPDGRHPSARGPDPAKLFPTAAFLILIWALTSLSGMLMTLVLILVLTGLRR
nr:hypothetical protein GCM10020093_042790 [Planobispora longispora]